MFHSIIPHSHNFSQEQEGEINVIHHHEHSTSHDHEDESDSNWRNSLLGLLDDWGHSDLGEGHFEDFTYQNVESFDFSQNNEIEITPVPSLVFIDYSVSNTKEGDYFIRPPILYEQLNNCSEPLRGPPSIS